MFLGPQNSWDPDDQRYENKKGIKLKVQFRTKTAYNTLYL